MKINWNWAKWLTPFRNPKQLFKKVPLSLSIFIAILIAGVVTQTFARSAFPLLMDKFGWNLQALKEGKLYILWVGLLFGSQPGHFYSILAIEVLGLGMLEYRYGTKRAVLGFLLLGPISGIITTLILWTVFTTGINSVGSFLNTPDMGSSTSSLVCWGILLALEKGWWKQFFLWGTAIVLIITIVLFKETWVFDHLISFLLGLIIGFFIVKRETKRSND